MRTLKTTVYFFDELSEAAQQNAINANSQINVDDNWWLTTYEDAENIGLKITSFDLDQNKNAAGSFIFSIEDVIKNILVNHGENCDTYKTALAFAKSLDPILNHYVNSENGEDVYFEYTKRFLNALLADYANILQNECDYLQSDKAIKETLIDNEYEFTENGSMI